MPRPKSLLPNITIDQVQRAHCCQHNSSHELHRGDKRLKVRVQRTYEHFCAPCALEILQRDIAQLMALAEGLGGVRTASS
jgi:hypothetical protein